MFSEQESEDPGGRRCRRNGTATPTPPTHTLPPQGLWRARREHTSQRAFFLSQRCRSPVVRCRLTGDGSGNTPCPPGGYPGDQDQKPWSWRAGLPGIGANSFCWYQLRDGHGEPPRDVKGGSDPLPAGGLDLSSRRAWALRKFLRTSYVWKAKGYGLTCTHVWETGWLWVVSVQRVSEIPPRRLGVRKLPGAEALGGFAGLVPGLLP